MLKIVAINVHISEGANGQINRHPVNYILLISTDLHSNNKIEGKDDCVGLLLEVIEERGKKIKED